MAKFETLVDIYREVVQSFADRPLFGTKRNGQWQWITYREFGKLTDSFRSGLAALGLKKGDALAIISNNRVEWAATAYACDWGHYGGYGSVTVNNSYHHSENNSYSTYHPPSGTYTRYNSKKGTYGAYNPSPGK